MMVIVEIKFQANNITSKTIEQFFLNNIVNIFEKHAIFTWFLIKITADIIVIGFVLPKSTGNSSTIVNF